MIETIKVNINGQTYNYSKDITINEIYKIGSAYWINIAGFTSIPTETKNTAPKKSFTGFKIRSILFATSDPAKIAPIIKAPKAEEKPDDVANKTIPKQRATAVIRSVSSFKYFDIFFINVGTT